MEPNYRWELGNIEAKSIFTDKHGNTHNNVIKKVDIIYIGEIDNNKEEYTYPVYFNITDLSNFLDLSLLTKEQIIEWALNKMHIKEKEHIQKIVKDRLNNNPINVVNLKIN